MRVSEKTSHKDGYLHPQGQHRVAASSVMLLWDQEMFTLWGGSLPINSLKFAWIGLPINAVAFHMAGSRVCKPAIF